jgi:hypothetical protein
MPIRALSDDDEAAIRPLLSLPLVPAAFSGPKQPPNPEQKSHPIRRNPASVPEQNSHRPFVGLG